MTSGTVPADAGRHGRWQFGTPLSYVIGTAVAVAVLVPIVYVFIGGFRTTGQLVESPYALPNPWVPGNYTEILQSPDFLGA